MYRSPRLAAAWIALSLMRTEWCLSYLKRMPRRIEMVWATSGGSIDT